MQEAFGRVCPFEEEGLFMVQPPSKQEKNLAARRPPNQEKPSGGDDQRRGNRCSVGNAGPTAPCKRLEIELPKPGRRNDRMKSYPDRLHPERKSLTFLQTLAAEVE